MVSAGDTAAARGASVDGPATPGVPIWSSVKPNGYGGRPRWHISAFRLPRDGVDRTHAIRTIRELRARILFDHGRRPKFQEADGTHGDDQELDYGAWHFIARGEPDGPPLGYVRLSTPATAGLFQSRAFLGAQRYEQLLREARRSTAETFEHSRLVVEHRARKLGLGVYLNAVAIGAAHHLCAMMMVGTSGTKDGQDHFHERFGFRSVLGTRRYVDQYTEDVVVMVHDPGSGAGEYTELVNQLKDEFPRFVAVGVREFNKPLSPQRRRPAPLLRAATPHQHAHQPTLFEPTRVSDERALTLLLQSGEVRAIYDTLDEQLTELIVSREPSRRYDEDELCAKKTDQLAGLDAWAYGSWVWYPWSGRLAHVLPREEFRLVRTDRNRQKIQRPDQRRLLAHRIGVVGLSVGNSAAVTLALEGIAGAYRLADFDDCSLSNLNRLRAGVHELGVNKAVICARQMYEIDPYLEIEIYPSGLTDDNMVAFFDGNDAPIDLLVEECDTPYVKVAAREQARARGIPVVMDCNDRGMLDVERFDLEPNRPLLHSRIGNIESGRLRNLSSQAKADLVLKMIDAERISPELAAAFPEIGRTLSAWPQLASAVALGGAMVADACRRILLRAPCESGRFYVDFDELLAPDHNTAPAASERIHT